MRHKPQIIIVSIFLFLALITRAHNGYDTFSFFLLSEEKKYLEQEKKEQEIKKELLKKQISKIVNKRNSIKKLKRGLYNNMYTKFEVDTLKIDSLKLDTLKKDSLSRAILEEDTTSYKKSAFNDKVLYKARDTIITEITKKKISLYGNAEVKYDDFLLKAHFINIDYKNSSIFAKPKVDSLGKVTGKPYFNQGKDKYQTDSMRFNFNTKKAIIYGVVTKQGEGILMSKKLKKTKYNEVYAGNSKFCPCEDITDGTYFKTNKIKIGSKRQIITGPSHLYIGDSPSLLWVPFGIFPASKINRSGVIIPNYGEIRERGFYLQNGGYYVVFSENLDAKLLGSIYTRGGWESSLDFVYKKRYRYSGGLNFSYNVLVSQGEISNAGSNTFWLRWNHRPIPRGNSTFSANVNLGSTSYNDNVINFNSNNNEIQRRATSNFSSNINFTQKIANGLFNLSLAARHNQNSSTNAVNVTLPSFALSMRQLNPFKSKNSVKSRWYHKVVLRYGMKGTNNLSNNVPTLSVSGITIYNPPVINDETLSFAKDFSQILKHAKYGIDHDASLSVTLKLFKHYTLTPSVTYKERWYGHKLDYNYVGGLNADGKENGVRVDSLRGFSRAYDFNTSLSINTNIYGTKVINNPNRRVRAVRHHIQPSVSVSWKPDFSEPPFDFYKKIVVNEEGKIDAIPRFVNTVYGSPSKGESGSISLSVRNVLEAKIIPKKESKLKAKPEKVKIIENLSFNTSFNIFAEEYKLSNLTWSLRNSFMKGKLSLQLSGSVDPYEYQLNSISPSGTVSQTKIDRILNPFIGELWQMTNTRMLLTTRLNPDFFSGNRMSDEIPTDRANFSNDDEANNMITPRLPYIDWAMPWNLSFTYSASFNRVGFQEGKLTHNLQFNGDVSLSEKWKLTFSSAYDFQSSQLTSSNLAVNRDLGCWEMGFNWVPFGRFTSYNFNLNIKAQMLKDLKYNKRSSTNF